MPPARTDYTRQTTFINDVVTHKQETIVTETFTTTYASEPAPMTKAIEHLSREGKLAAMQTALLNAEKELRRERRKRKDLKRFGLVFVASVFVLVTGYVSIDTWVTNNRVKAETAQGQVSDATTVSKADEGKDETKPTAAMLGKYAVAPSLPRVLYINKLHIAARIMPMGVNNDGSIQAPGNIYDAGWYNGSVKPGDIGAMFIDGHASGPTREGLFAYLDTLAAGDEIQVEKGDGSRLTYRVVTTETVPLDSLDMKKALLPPNGTLRGLNLMTCTGEWIEGQETYNQRVIVYAEQIS